MKYFTDYNFLKKILYLGRGEEKKKKYSAIVC